MSGGRPDDLRKTIEELRKPTGIVDGKNWLRHREGKQDQRIDDMLLKGATKQEIAQDLIQKGLSKRDLQTIMHRVQRHIDHIRKEEHKLPLKQDINGVWRFDLGTQVEELLKNSIIKEGSLSQDIYLPQKADVEFAESQLRKNMDEVIGINLVLDQVEKNIKKSGKLLKDNWRNITERNIEIWFSGKSRMKENDNL
ncbi:MAG: hypothetical protein HY787_28110 [Deltaproteobacteria bacterium]|nr:hypothetical protein [Deltaproteobacteria bacterium]